MRAKHLSVRKLVSLSVLLALGVILNIAENYMVFFPAVPGMKLGLANTIGLLVLALFGPKEFLLIGFLRVLLAGTFSGFGSSFMMAMSGYVFSSTITLLLYHSRKLSIYGLSMMSAVFHGVGQVTMISILYQNVLMFNYLFILMFSGILMGLLIAFLTKIILTRVRFQGVEGVNYERNIEP
ncbi:MAG: Gx transporter family protein [Bacilli bacterium]